MHYYCPKCEKVQPHKVEARKVVCTVCGNVLFTWPKHSSTDVDY